jgi:diacylglycerol kinase family enzyme
VNRGRVPVSARRRLAAVAALVGTAGLVAFVIAVLLRNVGDLLVGLFGLAVAVTGGWWVITERIPRRAIGAVGVGAGLLVVGGAVVRGLDGAERIGVRIVILVVLLGITMACGRAAMVRELHHLDLHVRAGGPPTRPVLLCNPWSGGGKVERFGLRELATELGVETVMLDRGLVLEQLARDAVARGADCLGMAGGDGSQALVASIAVEHGLPFVCVSAGTRNHFALDLGLNRDDPRESMYAFRDAYERKVDFATVNDRFFVNNVSLGVYAKVVQEDEYRDAKVETTKTMLPEMLGRQAESFDLQFSSPEGVEIDGAILVMVSNNQYVIGASPDNAQRRNLDRGRLGVFAVTTRTGAEAARLFAAQAIGRRTRNPSWQEFTATEFEVRSRSGTAFAGIDGEALELPTPLRFRIHPRALTLLVPSGNIEAAERRRAREVHVGDLLAVAAGHEPSRQTGDGSLLGI